MSLLNADDEPEVEEHQRGGEENRIDQVEDAADAGKELARVFHVAAALDDGFGQIADDRGEAQSDAEDDAVGVV